MNWCPSDVSPHRHETIAGLHQAAVEAEIFDSDTGVAVYFTDVRDGE